MSTLQHFKMAYDPALDYLAIGQMLFGQNKCLITAEKLDVNAHVHVQGLTDLAETYFEKKLTDATKDHYQRRIGADGKTRRPVKRQRTGTDDIGFQYICKEDPVNVLYKSGFTDEDIKALHDASDAHVAEIKDGLRNHLSSNAVLIALVASDSLYQDIFYEALLATYEYYEKKNTMPPPNMKKLVVWALLSMSDNRSYRIHFMQMM